MSFKSDFDRPWSSKCLPIAECLNARQCVGAASGCVPDIICVAQITLKFIDHALIVYNWRLFLIRGKDLADLLRLKDSFENQVLSVKSHLPVLDDFEVKQRNEKISLPIIVA